MVLPPHLRIVLLVICGLVLAASLTIPAVLTVRDRHSGRLAGRTLPRFQIRRILAAEADEAETATFPLPDPEPITVTHRAVPRWTPPPCPMECDPDCRSGAYHCAEVHIPSQYRDHDPAACPAETSGEWAGIEAELARVRSRFADIAAGRYSFSA